MNAAPVSEIAALDEQVRQHKQAIRLHRQLAADAARKRDALIAFCTRNNIPIQQAQPQEAQPHARKERQP